MAPLWGRRPAGRADPASDMRNGYAAALVLALAGMLFLAFLAAHIRVLMDQWGMAQTDNETWTVSQLDVDLLKFQRAAIAADAAGGAPDALATLRLSGEVLFSRIAVIEASRLAPHRVAERPENLRKSDRAWATVMRHMPGIADDLALDDTRLAAALPALRATIDALAPDTRSYALVRLQQLNSRSQDLRAGLERLLLNFGIGAVLVIALLGGEALALMVFYGRLRARAAADERSRALLQQVVGSALDAIIVTDAAGVITALNGAAERIFGLGAAEALGRRFADLVAAPEVPHPPGDGAGDGAAATASTGRAIRMARHRSGHAFPAEVAVVEGADAGGRPVFFCFVHDVTERVGIERSLRRAHDAALRQEEAKTRFLGVVSHEMRTPLNGLVAALDVVLQTTRLTAKQTKFLRIARDCSTTAIEQIEDLLELTRLSARQEEQAESSRFALDEVLAGIVEQMVPLAGQRGNHIVLDAPGVAVIGPRRLFTRTVANLLGNAVKFTRDGRIEVRATARTEGDSVLVRVEVADSGVGVAPADRERIFDDFETADTGYRREVPGSGLGLGIARRAVERMGGRIGVDSTPGAGSLFWFTARFSPAPAALAAETGAALPAPRGGAGSAPARVLSVLLVEDSEPSRVALCEMIRALGHRVEDAANGQQAVAALRAGRFDLVLMDISMPVLDGVSATRQIRAEAIAPRTPIIGLTAFAETAEVARLHEAGMQRVLRKPIGFDGLRTFLDEMIAGPSALPASDPGPGAGADPDPADITAASDPETIADLRRVLGPARFAAIWQDFLAECADALAAISRALAAGRLDEAAAQAHRAAGSSGAFGAARLGARMRELETRARQGDAPGAHRAEAAAAAALAELSAEGAGPWPGSSPAAARIG